MNDRFKDQVVWIVGADTPVGQELVKAFAKEGASLLLSGVEKAPDGIAAKCYPIPLTDEIARATVADNQRIDTLVFCQPDSPDMDIEHCTVEFWDKELQKGLAANYCACRAAMKIMGPAGKGTFLSVVSFHDEKPNGAKLMLSVCAGGSNMLMREAAQDYGRMPGSFRCNVIEVGPMEGDEERFDASKTAYYYTMDTKVPRRKAGKPSEIVGAALFLCSDEASYINGATLRIDGGYIGFYGDGDSRKRWEYGYNA